MDVEIRPSPIHGRGVFATADVGAGEVIETCHLQEVPGPHPRWLDRYAFEIDNGHGYAVASGCGQFYNEPAPGDEPNGRFDVLDHPSGPWVQFVAVRPICAGEEITIDYGINGVASQA